MGLDVYIVQEKYYDKPSPHVRSFLTWFVRAQLDMEKVSGITKFYFFGDERDFFVKLKWKEMQEEVKSYVVDCGINKINKEASAKIYLWINSLPWVRDTYDKKSVEEMGSLETSYLDYYIT